MSKSKRLMELMMTVNRKRRFKVQELADEFGVSRRTILRDLQELSELGVPLYSEVGPHGGYQVVRERVLPLIAFTEGEATAMFFAVQSLRNYTSLPFEAESASALRKFYLNMPGDIRERVDSMKDRVEFVTPARRGDAPCLPQLLEAAINGSTLFIDYAAKGKQGHSSRRIKPVLLYAHNGFWYCTAYCYLREGYRVFRCDRISNVTVDESAAKQPLDPSHVQMERLETATPQHTVRIRAELSRYGVERCEGEHWFHQMLTVHDDGSGTIDGHIPQSDLSFFAQFFIGLGTEVFLHEPEQLKAEIRQKLQELLTHHQ